MTGRLLTADLRGVVDDGRRWWAVAGRTYGSPWFYAARSGREAVAQHRRESIASDVSQGYSRRDATKFIRAQELGYAGPYTTREAFVLDAGWQLAHAYARAYRNRVEAAGPCDDLDLLAPMVSDEKIERVLDEAAKLYRTPQPIGRQ